MFLSFSNAKLYYKKKGNNRYVIFYATNKQDGQISILIRY